MVKPSIPQSLQPPSPKVLTKPSTIKQQKVQQVIVKRELTKTELEQFKQQALQENAQTSLQAIDREIQKENQRLENIKSNIKKAIQRGDRERTENLERRFDEALKESRENIKRLQSVKGLASTGQYTPSSLVKYAWTLAADKLEQVEKNREFKVKMQQLEKQYQQAYQKQLKEYYKQFPTDDKFVTTREGIIREVDLKKPTPKVVVPLTERQLAKKQLLEKARLEPMSPLEKAGVVAPAYTQVEKIEPERRLSDRFSLKIGSPIGIGTMPLQVEVEPEAITKPIRKVSEKITDLPFTVFGERQKTEEELFAVRPKISGVPTRETITYEPPELKPSEKIRKERIVREAIEKNIMQEEADKIIEDIYDKYYSELKVKMDRGEITEINLNSEIKKIRKSATTEIEKEIQKLDDKYREEFELRERKRVVNTIRSEMKEDFWLKRMKDFLTVGLYAVPYAGTAFFVSDIYSAPSEIKKGSELITKYPELGKPILKETGISLATMGIAGIGIGGLKGMRTRTKIKQAIDEGTFKIESGGLLTEKRLDTFKISESQKVELKRLLDSDNTLKIQRVKLVPKKGFEKYTPDIEGRFIEITDRLGNIVKRVAIGDLKATYQKQSITKAELAESIYKLNKKTGNIEGYTEVVDVTISGVSPLPYFGRKPKITKFKEELKLTGMEKLPNQRVRKIETESAVDLLGTSPYKGEPMTLSKFGFGFDRGKYWEVLPEFKDLKGKRIIKAKSKELQKQVEVKGEVITPFGDYGLVRTTSRYFTYGGTVAKGIKETKKPTTKTMKGFIEDAKVKKPKQEKFEPYKGDVAPSRIVPESIFSKTSFGEVSGISSFDIPSKPLIESITRTGVQDVSRFGIMGFGVSEIGRPLTTIKTKQVPKEKTKVGLQPVLTSSFDLSIEKEKLKQTPSNIISSSLEYKNPIKDYQETAPSLKLFQPQAQPQKLRQLLKQKQFEEPTITTAPPSFIVPPVKGGFLFNFEFPGEDITKERAIGYHTYVKEKGKFSKVSDKPMTRKGAKSMGARFVDNTTAATFKIEPITVTRIVQGEKKEIPRNFAYGELDSGDGFFNSVAKKFRDYVIQKGRAKPIQNTWIEKKGKRADTSGEQRGLTVAKYKSEMKKKAMGVPLRKRKKQGGNVKRFFGI